MIDPLSRLSDLKRVLVLSPHPDDETLGCGGTLALLSQGGCEVLVAVLSDGAKIYPEDSQYAADISSIRKQECLAAAGLLGVRKVHFLDFPDGGLQACKDGMSLRVADMVEALKPDIIFSPSPTDYHPDHIAVSRVAIKLLQRNDITIAFYEVYGTVRFNQLIDISSVAGIKDKAIMAYSRSLYGKPEMYCEAIKGFNRYRMLYTLKDANYEAFWIVSGPADAGSLISWVTYGLNEMEDREKT